MIVLIRITDSNKKITTDLCSYEAMCFSIFKLLMELAL